MIVLDASAVLELLLRTPAGIDLEERIFAPGETLHSLYLVDVEVAQVLRRYAGLGDIAPDRVRRSLTI